MKPRSVDVHVSGSIISAGVWEENEVRHIMKMMDAYPKALFLDIGANIGQS